MSGTILRPTFSAKPIRRASPRIPTHLERLCGLADDLNQFVNTLPRHLQDEGRRLVVRLDDIAETIHTVAPR